MMSLESQILSLQSRVALLVSTFNPKEIYYHTVEVFLMVSVVNTIMQ